MRTGLRMFRRLLGASVIAVVLLIVTGYVIYAANGIWNEVEAHEVRQRNDRQMAPTATALAERLAQLSVPAAATEGVTQPPAEETPLAAAQAASETPGQTASPTLPPSATATTAPTLPPTEPPTVTLIPTNTARPTLIPTNTPRPSATPLPTDTPLPTATFTPSITPTPTLTFTPTLTLTPSLTPTPTYVIQGTYAVPVNTPVVEIPPRVPLMEDDDDIVNILLLGSDTSNGGTGRTDVIILLSINKRAGSAAMWHIPRDLFVYVPNHTMDRLNLAFSLGISSNYPGGGFGLMKETFLYNFGIEVDHYARVDFADFMAIVDRLGGLEVSVDCSIQDWKLKDPELDPTVEENWEMYTLPIGRQTLDPYTALWYVRSRKTTNDLDRGRRQMDVLRAMWQQALKQGLLEQVTELWPEAVQVVETDMTLADVLSFVPLATSLDPSRIARYSGVRAEDGQYIPFLTPDDGRDVSLINRDKLLPMIQDFLTPPTENRLARQAVTVDIVDVSAWNIGFDQVAADRLAWEGFAAHPLGQERGVKKEVSLIYDYTGQTKGSALDDLKRVLRIGDAQVVVQPDPNRTVDYRVEIGTGYNSCVYGNAEDEIPSKPPTDEQP